MSLKVTTVRKIKKPVQILAETTEGTFPATGSFVSFPCSSLEWEIDGQYVNVEQIGVEDIMEAAQGNLVTGIRTTGPLIDTVLLQRLMNAANDTTPAGTVSEPLSLLYSQLIDGTETYFKFVGVRVKSGSIKCERGKPHELSVSWECIELLTPTTTAPTGVTMVTTFPSGSVYKHKDMGASALVWNSIALKFGSLTINVDRATKSIHIAGQSKPYAVEPMKRALTGSASLLYLDHTAYTELNTDTERAYTVTLNSTGPKTITGNGKITKVKKTNDAGGGDAIMADIDLVLTTATVN